MNMESHRIGGNLKLSKQSMNADKKKSLETVFSIATYFIYTIVPGSGLVDAMVAAHY